MGVRLHLYVCVCVWHKGTGVRRGCQVLNAKLALIDVRLLAPTGAMNMIDSDMAGVQTCRELLYFNNNFDCVCANIATICGFCKSFWCCYYQPTSLVVWCRCSTSKLLYVFVCWDYPINLSAWFASAMRRWFSISTKYKFLLLRTAGEHLVLIAANCEMKHNTTAAPTTAQDYTFYSIRPTCILCNVE